MPRFSLKTRGSIIKRIGIFVEIYLTHFYYFNGLRKPGGNITARLHQSWQNKIYSLSFARIVSKTNDSTIAIKSLCDPFTVRHAQNISIMYDAYHVQWR